MRDPVFHRMTDYDRSLLPNRHLASLDEGVTTREEWTAKSGLSIGYPGWGLLYHVALCALDPDAHNLIVETGTNIGSSTTILAQALIDSGRDGEVRTVELEEANHDRAAENLRAAGVADRVTQYLGNSLERLPEMLDSPHPVSIAFLDGNHEYDHVLTEFELVEPKLRFDSLVVLDNTYAINEEDKGEDPRVNGALREILARWGGNAVNLPFCSWYTPGIALWQRQPFEDMTPPPRA